MKSYPQLAAIHGKGFDHQIVVAKTRTEVGKVYAWESDSFEMAQVMAASTAMLNVLKDIAGVYADFNGTEDNYPGWMDDVKDVIAQATKGK
jgi:hypothetical protein